MKVSAITGISNECTPRRNNFIRFSNSFMSKIVEPTPKPEPAEKAHKMGLETLEEFTIFPKEIIDGHMSLKA